MSRNGYNPNRYYAFDSGFIFLLTVVVLNFLSLFLGTVFHESLNELKENNQYQYYFLSLVLPQAIILGVTVIYAAVKKVSPVKGGGYGFGRNWLDIAMGMLLIFGVYAVFNRLHTGLAKRILEFLEGNGIKVPEDGFFPSGSAGTATAIIYWACYLLLPPIAEELLFRGSIMRGLEEYGPWAAIFVTGLMFAFLHGRLTTLMIQFIGGAVISFVALATKDMLVALVMHFFYNVVAIVDGRLLSIASWYDTFYVFELIFGIVCLAIGMIWFIRLMMKKKADKGNVGKTDKSKKNGSSDYFVYVDDSDENGKELSAYYGELNDGFDVSGKRFLICGQMRKMNTGKGKLLSVSIIVVSILFSAIFINWS